MEISTTAHEFYQRFSIQILALILVALSIFLQRLLSRPSLPTSSPKPTSTNRPIIGDIGFFTARWTWWNKSVAQSSTGNFSYHLGKHAIVGVSGEKGRKLFFDSKDLGFSEG
jgi:hypothetical protein